jgi:signal transduction histidine kinase/DNA-binding response OmpR family regulator
VTEGDGRTCLRLLAGYADRRRDGYPARVALGEGLIGQSAVEKRRIHVTDIPTDTVRVGSVLFDAVPRSLLVVPIMFEDQIKAVIALASLNHFDPAHLTFLEQLSDSIGILLNSIEAAMQTEALLTQSQQLAAELQSQQTELQQTNEELERKAQQLAERNVEVEAKNQEIERARRALEEKATELSLTSKYKSEFLANMSHELRTPLNSILVLGQQLADNLDRNLTDKQVEFARTIHGAGTDLMNLISDILDLSKIESGTVSVDAEEVHFANLIETVARPFRYEADRRQLSFDAQLDPDLPNSLVTDSKRLQQVLKNLLSNAFKFTEHGGVKLRIAPADSGWSSGHLVLSKAPRVAGFEVADTGIGISPDKQKIVFEAFQQADASTSRKYGGTGLGLAISRELANLLGGEIQLRSTPGEGSTFTLYLPLKHAEPRSPQVLEPTGAAPRLVASSASDGADPTHLPDERDDIRAGDQTLLIVEDDTHFARVLLDLAHECGFKVLMAATGADALALAGDYCPTAVFLDAFLPDMLGWTVLSRLKQDPATRHIPVQMVAVDGDRRHALSLGALSLITKSANPDELRAAFSRLRSFAVPRRKRLLVVEGNSADRLRLTTLLGHEDIDMATTETVAEALEILRRQGSDCVVLDLRLPGRAGLELLERIGDDEHLADIPVVVFTGRQLTPEQDAKLQGLARSLLMKAVDSPERVLDETALFLHRVVSNLPPEKQAMLQRLHRSDENLAGRTVLLVDDDARNIFALSSALERRGMRVLSATTGNEAIGILKSTPEVAIALMDIMMPDMDGYQTMQEIRKDEKLCRLPIIALTAKAMKGDREKCVTAGASDYLAKPVNTEQLLAALRMWLRT